MSSNSTQPDPASESGDERSETASVAENPDEDTTSAAELRGQVELLEAENQRLRREYVRARQTKYRRTALGLAVVGLLALGGGAVFPGNRDVLLALGGSAVVAGILTYYLTPEEFVVATVGERLAATLQETYSTLRSDLDLQGDPVYVPLTSASATDARLFLPQHHEYTIPDEDALQQTIVVPASPSQRGLAVPPSGGGLFDEFRTAADLASGPDTNPERVFDQLADGLVEQFELADQVTPTVEGDTRCVIAVTGSTYGTPSTIDHPITSFIAVGTAVTFNQPTRVTVRTTDDDDFVFECNWDTHSGETSDDS